MKTTTETFMATVVGYRGNVIRQLSADSVSALIERVANEHDGATITIRGEYTSDGTHWGIGRGRVVADRDGNRKWTRF